MYTYQTWINPSPLVKAPYNFYIRFSNCKIKNKIESPYEPILFFYPMAFGVMVRRNGL